MVQLIEPSSSSPRRPSVDISSDYSDGLNTPGWVRDGALTSSNPRAMLPEFDLRPPRARGNSREVAFSPSKRIHSFNTLAPASTQTPAREEAMREYRRTASAGYNRESENSSFLGPGSSSPRRSHHPYRLENSGVDDRQGPWLDLEVEAREVARASADYDSTGGEDLTTDASDLSLGAGVRATPSSRRRRPSAFSTASVRRNAGVRRLLPGNPSLRRSSNNAANLSGELTSESDYQTDSGRAYDESLSSMVPSPAPSRSRWSANSKGPNEGTKRWLLDPDTPHLLQSYLQLLFNCVMIFTAVYLAAMFVSTVRSDVDKRVAEYSIDIENEIEKCAEDYLHNRCQPGTRVPALESQCSAWEACMNRDPKLVGRARVSAETFGQIVNSFMEPIGFKSLIFFVALYLGTFMLVNVYLPTKATANRRFSGRAPACAEPGLSTDTGAGACVNSKHVDESASYIGGSEMLKTPLQRRRGAHVPTPRSHRRP